MPCAVGELCDYPELISPGNHVCRGMCDRRLHGSCGEVEDPDGTNNEVHRICHDCVAKKKQAAADGASSAGKRTAAADTRGRKGLLGLAAKRAKTGLDRSMSRVRLSLSQKEEVLGLLTQKVTHAEIARRFGCSERTVASIATNKAQLEKDLAAVGGKGTAKSMRKGDFPKVEEITLQLVQAARKNGMPVMRETIKEFGVAAKNNLLAKDTTTAAEKEKLERFSGSMKGAKNFVARNKLVSKALHGEAGSVDPAAVAKGMEEIREACKDYQLTNIFSVDETGIFDNIVPGQPAHQAAIKAAQTWAGLEENEEIKEVLRLDTLDELMEVVNSTSVEYPTRNLSDDEVQEDSTAAGGWGGILQPSYAALSEHFGQLEHYAESCGNVDAGHFLRKARMSFIAKHASTAMRQTDIREFA